MTLAARQLQRIDVPSFVMHVVGQLEPDDKKLAARLFLVMSELVNNALDHGLLKMESELKHSRQGIEHYFEERAARLGRLEQGEIRIRLCKLADPARQCLIIDVRDSGEGFNHAEALSGADSGAGQARHGRGMALVRSMSGIMRYDGNGSCVHVCLPVGGAQCGYRNAQQDGDGAQVHR
ncbi:MAG: ATP-binding protein [Nitrosomonadales bacterium]|nr:ATP-binding protein [Nitrosomonadales bacterium]